MSPALITEQVAACLAQIPQLVGPHAEILDFAAWPWWSRDQGRRRDNRRNDGVQ